MQGRPEVSVVIPAYRAGATLRRAVRSVLASGLPANQIEIAIASDDGQDYSAMVPPEIALVQADPGPIASGVGPARNRAVNVASGRFLAFLDADDTSSSAVHSPAPSCGVANTGTSTPPSSTPARTSMPTWANRASTASTAIKPISTILKGSPFLFPQHTTTGLPARTAIPKNRTPTSG